MKKFYQRLHAIILLSCIFCLCVFPPVIGTETLDKLEWRVTELEQKVFGESSRKDIPIEQRLSKLEKNIFGTESTSKNTEARLKVLEKIFSVSETKDSKLVLKEPETTEINTQVSKDEQKNNTNTSSNSSSNDFTHSGQARPELKELKTLKDETNLSETLVKIINQERELRNLKALSLDDVAKQVSLEHASYLAQTGQFSYYGFQSKNPDERYSEKDGNGRISEIVDGFFSDSGKKIELNSELPHQLADKLLEDTDKTSVILNKEANAIAISFVLSPDKEQLVVVIEILAKYGSFGELPKKISSNENKLAVNGYVGKELKFSWIGVGRQEATNINYLESEPGPYFPPIDEVIFLDKKESNARKIASGAGLLLATVAAPFTYGASLIVADVLLQQAVYAYKSKDVEMKGGINADIDGNFSGQISIGDRGPGKYYVSIWATDTSDSKHPFVISRRVINVE